MFEDSKLTLTSLAVEAAWCACEELRTPLMHYILRSRAKARVVRCNLRAKNFTSALQRRLWTPSFSQKFKWLGCQFFSGLGIAAVPDAFPALAQEELLEEAAQERGSCKACKRELSCPLASNLLAMASTLVAMASNLRAMTSNLLTN